MVNIILVVGSVDNNRIINLSQKIGSVICEVSLSEALYSIEKFKPNIVLLNYKDNDIAQLKNIIEDYCAISFFVMSGSSGYRDVVESLGAVFIEKPFDFDVLTKMIKKKLEK